MTMTRRNFVKWTGLGLGAAALVGCFQVADTGAAPDKRPNIVLILADDMGYSDPGCVGGEVRTPNMDRLAAEGVLFTNFWNNGKCLPTRQSLFTGHYARQIADETRVVSLHHAMRAAGYGAYMAGKCHGNSRRDWDESVTMYAAGNHWGPNRIWVNGVTDREFLQRHPDFYSTDVWTDYALKYMDQHREKRPNDPFFLYLAFNAPHDPLHAREEDIARYEGVYSEGWDVIRRRRYERVKELGVHEPGLRLPPKDPAVPAWESLPDKEREYEERKMMVYAAMVDRIDQSIGRVLRKLDELGIADNTLVIYLSDNGASKLAYADPKGSMPGPNGANHGFGRGWAHACNSPFVNYKSSPFAGGSRTPVMFRWPARIKPGIIDRDFAHVVDLPATFLDLAGAPNHRILGKTLVPIFDGKKRSLHAEFGFAFKDSHAFREGKWKIVREGNAPEWQLYDIEKDPTEIDDLAKVHPDIVARLDAKWIAYNKDVVYRGQAKELKPADLPDEPTSAENKF